MSIKVVEVEKVHRHIISIRGHRVMLAEALADMYGVEVRALNQAVKRNQERFPEDFAFRLTSEEAAVLKSQTVISSLGTHGGARRALPMAFTEQGVAMLSEVLTSPRAVAVNVEIMRAFVQMRQILTANADLARKLATLEATYDKQFQVVFEAIRQLMTDQDKVNSKKQKVGFNLK